jgi:hypothetical protein
MPKKNKSQPKNENYCQFFYPLILICHKAVDPVHPVILT